MGDSSGCLFGIDMWPHAPWSTQLASLVATWKGTLVGERARRPIERDRSRFETCKVGHCGP
jgi:hypothetical protein